ncbi:Hypothetical protein DIP1956 [Corynebacterium diphtheriae]|uniref:Insertion element IS150 protein InsJ-like helix-turn-helix domain-containing protein n=1 Tax=Corynebacterium diphtheriae (strain ATCC 700971 / NCTC 13129 / Biotype gravis) TaxID=257309 RepID=Q6NFD8_CORDI|nr:Hypothetical protein DIP1956 [Corynebacterium diphtheriae]
MTCLSRDWATAQRLVEWALASTRCECFNVDSNFMAGLCLVENPTKQHYSFEVRKQVVDRFNAGQSKMDLAREFGLSSDQLVSSWVRAWRAGGDEALRPKPKGRPKGSASSKPLTEEDRLRREVEKLRAENAYLKKLRDLRNQRRS